MHIVKHQSSKYKYYYNLGFLRITYLKNHTGIVQNIKIKRNTI